LNPGKYPGLWEGRVAAVGPATGIRMAPIWGQNRRVTPAEVGVGAVSDLWGTALVRVRMRLAHR
jgi:hypothetical protein